MDSTSDDSVTSNVSLLALPLEVVRLIVAHVHGSYIHDRDPALFSLMRTSCLLRDLCFEAHFWHGDYRLHAQQQAAIYSLKGGSSRSRSTLMPGVSGAMLVMSDDVKRGIREQAITAEKVKLILWDDRWATAWERRKQGKDKEARDGLGYSTSGVWETWMCKCDWLASGEVPPKKRRKTRVIEGGRGKG